LMVCLVCISMATTLFGKTDPKNAAAYNAVVSDYVHCHMTSDAKKLNRILHDDARFKISRGENLIVQDRSKLITQMKQQAGIQQNCESKYQLLAESDAMVIAKVDFTYGASTQTNYLVIEKGADKTWKITQVCKFFNEAQRGDGSIVSENS
ncbi:MAG: hypothetical protein EOP47_18060, partial [Sphingobacteriaceae bacterium]